MRKQNKQDKKTDAERAFDKAKEAFEVARNIYKTASAFEKASESKRRVMIAKDALKQLRMGRYVATPGTYVNACNLSDEAKIDQDVQLNTLLHNSALKSSCNVCARGALLLSAVRHRNDCTIDPGGDTSEDCHVEEFADQQYAIEEAFEDYDDEDGGGGWADKFLSDKERSNPEKRLELILKNIIRNKGTFKKNQR